MYFFQIPRVGGGGGGPLPPGPPKMKPRIYRIFMSFCNEDNIDRILVGVDYMETDEASAQPGFNEEGNSQLHHTTPKLLGTMQCL